MGGTFNPPHNGHIHAAQQAVHELHLDKLLLIPDNVPPHKVLPKHSADSRQRFEMAKLMALDIPKAQASDIELMRGGRSYTVDTLRELHERYPNDTLILLVGTDMLLTLDAWREPEQLCRLAQFAVVARDDRDRAAIAQKAQQLAKQWNAAVTVVDCPAVPVSSTQVRADQALCETMVPARIFSYIKQQGLYF